MSQFVWMSSYFFQIAETPNSYSLILTKTGKHDLYPSVQKSVEQIFESLILKFFASFFTFYIWT